MINKKFETNHYFDKQTKKLAFKRCDVLRTFQMGICSWYLITELSDFESLSIQITQSKSSPLNKNVTIKTFLNYQKKKRRKKNYDGNLYQIETTKKDS